MKKFVAVVAVVVMVLVGGCATTDALPVNGFDYSGKGTLEWFEVTDSEFIETFNTKLAEAGYATLVLRDPESEESLDFIENGSKYPYLLEMRIHKGDRKIRSLQANFDIERGADPDKAGFYYKTLIETFAPRYSEEVIDYLHIFTGVGKGFAAYEYTVGNTVFVFTGRVLGIHPIEYVEPTTLPVRPQ